MASYSNHALGKILPSGVEKVSSKGNRYYMQSIELFSHVDEDNYPQFVKESFYLERPLPEGKCLLRFEHNPKGGPPQLNLVCKLSSEQYKDFIKLLSTGSSGLKTHKDEDKLFQDITPETKMQELLSQNNSDYNPLGRPI